MKHGLGAWILGVLALAVTSTMTAPSAGAQGTPAPAPGPSLSFSAQTIQVVGMTPAGTVIWFGVGRDVQEYAAVQSLVPQVGTADGQGQATLTLPGPVPALSIWIGVDYQTGAYALGSPSADFPVQQAALDPSALSRGSGTAPDFLSDAADGIHLLLVRPGHGAWIKTLGRGGADDESDPGDARLRLRLSRMTALVQGGDAPPAKVSAKDLLFVVHPRTMDVAILTAGAQP